MSVFMIFVEDNNVVILGVRYLIKIINRILAQHQELYSKHNNHRRTGNSCDATCQKYFHAWKGQQSFQVAKKSQDEDFYSIEDVGHDGYRTQCVNLNATKPHDEPS